MAGKKRKRSDSQVSDTEIMTKKRVRTESMNSAKSNGSTGGGPMTRRKSQDAAEADPQEMASDDIEEMAIDNAEEIETCKRDLDENENFPSKKVKRTDASNLENKVDSIATDVKEIKDMMKKI